MRGGPVWDILPITSKGNPPQPLFALASWDKTLTFYDYEGKRVGRERKLSFYPTTLSCSNFYLFVGGSAGEVSLHTKEGIRLSSVITDV